MRWLSKARAWPVTGSVKAMVRVLQDRYGLSRRPSEQPVEPPSTNGDPEQVAFRWD